MEHYNIQTILEAVASRPDDLITHLFPQARKQAGCYRVGGIDGERGDSMSISTKPNNAGSFFDHANHEVRGNAIGLWSMARHVSYQEAIQEVARFLGVSPEARLMPKKRPTPKIQQAERTCQCGGRTVNLLPLNTRSVQYAASRGISSETLRAARCVSTDSEIVFTHFNEDNQLVMVKFWSCDGQKRICTNDDPIPVLFNKHAVDPLKTGSRLIITEGHWDALTWQQLGYPAVSIPSGVSNKDWINEDWNFLNWFDLILLDFDDDAAGHDAEADVRVRLGHERCRSIRYRFKDANAALMAGEPQVLLDALNHAITAPIDKIVNAADRKASVRERLCRTSTHNGIPFFLPSLPVIFKPHQIIVWYGTTKHGKSTILSNQIAYSASLGHCAMVSSFEEHTDITIGSMLRQYTNNVDIAASSQYDEAYDDLTSKVFFFDSMERADPNQLIATMIMAHRQLGAIEFVVDNAMTLDVDRQDNKEQAAVADKFRVFASRFPVILHLVMHPRKPPAQESNKPPTLADVMGAMEWTAMAHKIICVWRDVGKAQRLAEMRDENIDPVEIMTFDNNNPDGKIFIRGDRETGDLPMTAYWFDRLTKRAWKNPEDLQPYWTACPIAGITTEDDPF